MNPELEIGFYLNGSIVQALLEENLVIHQRQRMDSGLQKFLISENTDQPDSVILGFNDIDSFHYQTVFFSFNQICIGFAHGMILLLG
jgi:hypothetical protein